MCSSPTFSEEFISRLATWTDVVDEIYSEVDSIGRVISKKSPVESSLNIAVSFSFFFVFFIFLSTEDCQQLHGHNLQQEYLVLPFVYSTNCSLSNLRQSKFTPCSATEIHRTDFILSSVCTVLSLLVFASKLQILIVASDSSGQLVSFISDIALLLSICFNGMKNIFGMKKNLASDQI